MATNTTNWWEESAQREFAARNMEAERERESTTQEPINDTPDTAREAEPSQPHKGKSKYMKHFTRLEDKVTWSCNLCADINPLKKVLLRRNKDRSTTIFQRHLKRFHKDIFNEIEGVTEKQKSMREMMDPASAKTIIYKVHTNEVIKEEMARLVCTANLPFRMAENEDFRRWSRFCARSDMFMPSAKATQRTCFKLYEARKKKVADEFRNVAAVSLTVDAWKSDNDANMLGITAHWIDDEWMLRNRVLSLGDLYGGHDGNSMANVMKTVLEEFGLTTKICGVTTDNASSNGKMMRALAALTSHIDVKMQVPCTCHIVNLVVQAGLVNLRLSNPVELFMEGYTDDIIMANPQISVIAPAVTRVRDVVTLIRNSSNARSSYREMCRKLGAPNENNLPLDAPTRWNSTFDMLTAAYEKRQVLSNTDVVHSRDLVVSADEWNVVAEFIEVLRPFKRATDRYSGNRVLTFTEVLACVRFLKSHLTQLMEIYKSSSATTLSKLRIPLEQRASLFAACDAMLTKLNKYIEILHKNDIVAMATLFSPIAKTEPLEENRRTEVMTLVQSLIDNFAEELSTNAANENLGDPNEGDGAIIEDEDPFSVQVFQATNLSNIMPDKNELEEYMRAANCSTVDALSWWKSTGEKQYPKMAQLAKKFLCVSPSSTPAERMFSAARGIVTYKRCRLLPSTIEMLLTLGTWERIDPSLTLFDEEMDPNLVPLDLKYPDECQKPQSENSEDFMDVEDN